MMQPSSTTNDATSETAPAGTPEVWTATHWGNFRVGRTAGGGLGVRPAPGDEAPSPLGRSLDAWCDPGTRVRRPAVRESYLRRGRLAGGEERGHERFVEVPWDVALDLAAEALADVRQRGGDEAVYGGSYGWSSAGRFHHAQSQIHRFLAMGGGYTASVDDYSAGAARVIVPHVTGMSFYQSCQEAPSSRDMAEHCRLVVCFGGAPMKNNEMSPGGIGNHHGAAYFAALRDAGVSFVNVGPISDDMMASVQARWLPCRPNADVAVMLGLAHTLASQGLHDRAFLASHCTGYPAFEQYLFGAGDGQPKDAAWAERLSGVPAATIRDLALQMRRERSVIGLSLSIQRQQHGEQAYWAATALAAMLGHFGLPGGGIVYGFGTLNMSFMERRRLHFAVTALPQGGNPVRRFIPVARLADMLLRPGEAYTYDGQTLHYPDIKLVQWAGGNPFHHHQDLFRLERAWARPETVIVHEMSWTATARRADIVFPAATPLERNDFAAASGTTWISPMRQLAKPLGEARTDYEVFAALAERLGYGAAFTEGRDEMQWIRHLYETSRVNAARADVVMPSFDEFWAGGPIDLGPQLPPLKATFEAFRADPARRPLRTPSGRLELYSELIAGFGLDDCRGHPAWYDKHEWQDGRRDRFPLHLVSNQPVTRLHSQLDAGAASRESKMAGREPLRMNPQDAAERGLREGDVVRVYNDRGALLAGVRLSDALMRGVVQLATGAWFDPQTVQGERVDVHGNPNVLTPDIGTSGLAQGCSAQSCLCQVERFDGPLPSVTVHSQPAFSERRD